MKYKYYISQDETSYVHIRVSKRGAGYVAGKGDRRWRLIKDLINPANHHLMWCQGPDLFFLLEGYRV